MAHDIPTDHIVAYLAQLSQHRLLITGPHAADLADLLGAAGADTWLLRYGFAHTTHTHLRIFPAQLADDRGNVQAGLDAVQRIAQAGQRNPRSELWGQHQDGTPAEYFLRDLDLGLPMITYAARRGDFPGVQVQAAIEVVGSGDIALQPGGNWPTCLTLSVPTYQIHRNALNADLLARLTQIIDADERRHYVALDGLTTFLTGEEPDTDD